MGGIYEQYVSVAIAMFFILIVLFLIEKIGNLFKKEIKMEKTFDKSPVRVYSRVNENGGSVIYDGKICEAITDNCEEFKYGELVKIVNFGSTLTVSKFG